MTLEQHLDRIKKQREQLVADTNACTGAILMLEALIQERDEVPSPEKAGDVASKRKRPK